MEDFTIIRESQMPEEIIYLIIKRLTAVLNSEETILLQLWLENSGENQRIFNEISDIWLASAANASENFNSSEALKKVKLQLEKVKYKPKNKSKLLNSILKVAALTILILAIAALSFYFGKIEKKTSSEITEIIAPMGSRTRIVLPDGSKVWLNGGSSLKFGNRFNSSDRIVSIIGEGYFDVIKNKTLPFIVNTKNIRIKVLGTAFNIKAYPDDGSIETTLEKGSLSIEKITENGNSIPQAMLEPNQRATYISKEGKILYSRLHKEQDIPKKDENVNKVQPAKEQLLISRKIDTQIFTSWKDNKLVFRNELFESLTVKLERWYGVEINIEDEEIRNYHFNGTFEKETIQDVLEIIKFTLPIKYIVNHDKITISLDKSWWKKQLRTSNN